VYAASLSLTDLVKILSVDDQTMMQFNHLRFGWLKTYFWPVTRRFYLKLGPPDCNAFSATNRITNATPTTQLTPKMLLRKHLERMAGTQDYRKGSLEKSQGYLQLELPPAR